MVQLIVGKKGKGKTKYLLDKVNNEIKTVSGNIVYLDKSTKHMFELNNKVRLIDVSDYAFENSAEFVGFVCGIISQDHDLEAIYLDSFLTITHLEEAEDLTQAIEDFKNLGEKYGIDFVMSISKDAQDLPKNANGRISVSL